MTKDDLNKLIVDESNRVIQDLYELINWIQYGEQSGEYDDQIDLIDCARISILAIRKYVDMREKES